MAVHVGPLSTTPDRDVPAEVVRVLGKAALAGVDAHVHIRSGIDSLLGDTHLTVVAGRLHVIARRTSLDPLEDVPIVAVPEIDEQGYRSVLVLRTPTGPKRVEIGATEENAVHTLVASLGAEMVTSPAMEPPPVEAPPAEAEPSPVEDAAQPALVDRTTLEGARSALVGVLVGRLAQRKAKLRADRIAHARGGPTRDAERRKQQSRQQKRPERAQLRAEVGTATTDLDGDGVPDSPYDPATRERSSPKRADPPQGSSILGLVVLCLLVMVGMLAAASRLLAEAK